MTERSTPFSKTTRLAAVLAAAGFLFAAPAVAQTQLPPPAYGNADARQDRLEELERQVREQTAENERLQYQLNQAQREITRLRAMVGELAGVNQSLSSDPNAAATGGTTPATPPRAPQGAPLEGGLNEAQQRATGTLGTMPANTPIPSAPAAADPSEVYRNAQRLLIDANYSEAEVAFADFLERYPTHAQAADARYWFAFTLLARHNYQNAAANFVQYLQRAPQGPRAPEAQVRLGMALIGMGQKAQGCGAFSQLTRRYPNAPRNVRDLAAREARAAECAA